MSENSSQTEFPRKLPGLCAYNLRVLLGNTYWLVVTPVAATQLVLFWNMATGTLLSSVRAAQTIEVLAPILTAFMAAHALAPELGGVRELVFARPVSFEKVLALRLAGIVLFVLAVLLPLFVIYAVGIDGFPLGLAVLAALPSMLLLGVFAMAVAAATRHPLAGLGAAGAFWALDLGVSGYFNPLVTLQGFAGFLANGPMADQWWVGKLVLLGLAGAAYVWSRRAVARPGAARRWRSAVVGAGIGVALLGIYVGSGAAYKVGYGLRHEHELGVRARAWYQRQLRGYGPIPVARLFGPAFPLYVQADLEREWRLGERAADPTVTPVDLSRLRLLLQRYPESVWADNAQFEIASYLARRAPSDRPWLVVACEAEGATPTISFRSTDVEAAAREFDALATVYPDSSFAPVALAERADIALGTLGFDAARSCYERLIALYPRADEAHRAGMGMAAVYGRARKWDKAFEAAEIAASTATWDLRAEALLAAARAARNAGEPDAARGRYERALAAARSAADRAMGGEPRPSGMAKGELFQACNAVIRECEEALAGSMDPIAQPRKREGGVSGLVLIGGEGAAEARVALGSEAGASGLPSPFAGPASWALTDSSGAFEMQDVAQGEYGALAAAVRVARGGGDWSVEAPALPVRVGDEPVTLGQLELKHAAPSRAAAPARAGTPSPGETERGRRGLRSRRGGTRPGFR